MHDVVFLLKLECLQNLYCKPPNEALRHSLKVVFLYKFVEINAKTLEGNHKVLSEEHEVFDSDDVVLVSLVEVV